MMDKCCRSSLVGGELSVAVGDCLVPGVVETGFECVGQDNSSEGFRGSLGCVFSDLCHPWTHACMSLCRLQTCACMPSGHLCVCIPLRVPSLGWVPSCVTVCPCAVWVYMWGPGLHVLSSVTSWLWLSKTKGEGKRNPGGS